MRAIIGTAFTPLQRSPLREPRTVFAALAGQRSFSASATRRISVYDIAVIPPTYYLDAFHAVGLPWWAALPAAAGFVRVFTYQFLAKPQRLDDARLRHLTPLLQARVINQLKRDKTRLKKPSELKKRLHKLKLSFLENRHILKVFNLRSKLVTMLTDYGILVWMAEAVRIKCGSSEGLVRVLVGPIEYFLVRPITSIVSGPSQDAQSAEVVVTADSVDSAVVDAATDAQINSIESSLFDSSLLQEGFIWSTDLTVPDPVVIASVFLFLCARTVLTLPPAAPKNDASGDPSLSRLDPAEQANLDENKSKRAKHLLGGWSFSAAFTLVVISHLPAAVTLYLLSSMTSSFVSSKLLQRAVVFRKPVTMCKRPLANTKVQGVASHD